MIPAAHASTGSIAASSVAEVTDSTTMTHGTSGGKVPSNGYLGYGAPFGSLGNTSFRDATIDAVYTTLSILYVTLSGNRAQSYFDRITCTFGTFYQSSASHSYNSGNDKTTWSWASAGDFSSSGSSTVDLIY